MGELGDLVRGYSCGEAKLKERRRGRLLRFVRFGWFISLSEVNIFEYHKSETIFIG